MQCNSSKKEIISKVQYENEYFPLKNNMSWKYVNEAPREETIIIDINCKIAENKIMFDNYPFFGNSESGTEFFTDESSNLFVKEKAGGSFLLLPPANKFADNYRWKYSNLLSAYMTKTPVEVKTEEGIYSCIYVVFTDGFTFSYEMWLAKGVGVVKWGANRTNPPSIPVYYVLKEHKE